MGTSGYHTLEITLFNLVSVRVSTAGGRSRLGLR